MSRKNHKGSYKSNGNGPSEKAKAALQKVVDRFQSGDLGPIVYVATFPVPADWPAANWSFRNQVIAYCQKGSLNCRGYQQWQTIDRQVKKGTSAGFIWGPRTKTFTDKAENGEEEKKSRLIGWITIPVFGPDDTEGETPLPDESQYTPKEMPPLHDVAQQFGIRVTWTPTPPDRRGDYQPGNQSIRLGTQDVRTWFHELAHAMHDHIDGLKGSEGHLEVTAEFTACVLMELYGFRDTSGYAWQYISSNADKEPMDAINDALGVVEQILEALGV